MASQKNASIDLIDVIKPREGKFSPNFFSFYVRVYVFKILVVEALKVASQK